MRYRKVTVGAVRWGMAKVSAGLVMYRRAGGGLEVLLVHPGGPFWVKKDKGFWSIPKGEAAAEEDLSGAARREFLEETGFAVTGPLLELGSVKQAGGKIVTAWAFAGDCDPATLRSNLCEIEWPPRSGQRINIPEVDRAAWFGLEVARDYILPSQAALLERLSLAVDG